MFGGSFRIHKEDEVLILKLCSYFIQDHISCNQMGIDTKGILLTGPLGCGKTSLMKLLLNLALHKTNYEIISTRNIVYGFNVIGFVIIEKHIQPKSICFDDLGAEPLGNHYSNECNVMGEILLSRYDLFCHPEPGRRVKTHITTNLNAQELEERYGNRVRSRLRAMFNLISFDNSTANKRK